MVDPMVVVRMCSREISSCSAGGDPYIYPLVGPAVKLPNSDQVYRLYQDVDVVVNGRVEKANPNIQSEINDLMHHSGLNPVNEEAYFFSRLFIGNRHDPTEHVLVDLEQKVTSGNTKMFHIQTPIMDTTTCPYDRWATSAVSIPIYWGDEMCLTIRFSRNPQIRNGMQLRGTNLQNGSGLLIRNYRPRFFQLLRIDSMDTVELPRNCKRTTTTRGTTSHRQTSVLISKVLSCL